MADDILIRDVEGQDVITEALMTLLNSFPGLESDEYISFSALGEDGGITFYPTDGAVIADEKEDILGDIHQLCLYPFNVFCRHVGLNENRKISTKEWLDTLGRWLEGQTVTIDNVDYKLPAYPVLTGDRKIKKIERQTPAYLDNINQNGTEDWAISLSVQYENNFNR